MNTSSRQHVEPFARRFPDLSSTILRTGNRLALFFRETRSTRRASLHHHSRKHSRLLSRTRCRTGVRRAQGVWMRDRCHGEPGASNCASAPTCFRCFRRLRCLWWLRRFNSGRAVVQKHCLGSGAESCRESHNAPVSERRRESGAHDAPEPIIRVEENDAATIMYRNFLEHRRAGPMSAPYLQPY